MLIIFWVFVGLTYLPTMIRMIAAYFNYPEMDLIMYNIASIPFAFISVPLVYFIIYVIIGNRTICRMVSVIFALFGLTYLVVLNTFGVRGPMVTEWASLYTINSDVAIHIYLIGQFVIPTAMILGLLFLLFLRRLPKNLRYRTTLPLVAISFVFDFMLTDVVTVIDVMQLSARLFVLMGTILAYLAYFPPLTLQDKLRINKRQYDIAEEDDIENGWVPEV